MPIPLASTHGPTVAPGAHSPACGRTGVWTRCRSGGGRHVVATIVGVSPPVDETREERGARGKGVSATNDRRIPGRSRWSVGRNLVAPPTLPSNGRVPCDVYVSERPTWLVVILASSHPARLHSRRNSSVRINRFLWMTANLRFTTWRFFVGAEKCRAVLVWMMYGSYSATWAPRQFAGVLTP
jgi:hypothetical protein